MDHETLSRHHINGAAFGWASRPAVFATGPGPERGGLDRAIRRQEPGNWNQIGDANWKLDDGVVIADKGNGFLISKNSYTDFQLRAEFWVDDDANSGIFIRWGPAT